MRCWNREEGEATGRTLTKAQSLWGAQEVLGCEQFARKAERLEVGDTGYQPVVQGGEADWSTAGLVRGGATLLPPGWL